MRNFREFHFCELRPDTILRSSPCTPSAKLSSLLLLGVCGGLFFLHYLKALDHLEGEAHYAAVLALVLEVDCFVVVVDEDLRHEPAAVVEPLCPFGDVFVRYLFGLLAHPHNLHSLQHCFYPEEAQCNPRLNVEHRRVIEPLFTGVRGIGILRSSGLFGALKCFVPWRTYTTL